MSKKNKKNLLKKISGGVAGDRIIDESGTYTMTIYQNEPTVKPINLTFDWAGDVNVLTTPNWNVK